jgi:hypothetical protein
MTKRERELSKEKVKHATEKNEENESGDYQYVVRGPLWERKHSQFLFLLTPAWPLSL